jgi:hypothetical protein
MDNTNKVYQGGEVLPTLPGVATQVPNLSLPKATPPTNVTAITNTPSFSVPSPSPSLGNTSSVGGLVSFYDQAFKVYDQQQSDLQNQITQAKTTQATETAPWYSKLVGAKTPEEVRSSAMSDTGVDAKEYFALQKASLEEIRKLNEDYNAEVAKKDEEINRLRDNSEGRSEGGISQEVARVENRYATRLNQISANINTKSAIFEAEQGRFAEAQQYINQAVQDATADTRYNLELFDTFYKTNQDTIDSLESKYQDAFKSALGFAEQKYQTDFEIKSQIGQLMLENPGAGITLNDSLSTAYSKAGKAPGGGKNLFTTSQLNTGANKAGLDLGTFSNLDYETKNFFINTSPTTVSGYMDIINSANDGTGSEDPEAVKEEINASNLAQPVKDYFISLLSTTTGGDTSSWWDRVRDFFNSGNSFTQ